ATLVQAEGVEENSDELAAGLDQPPRRQGRLAKKRDAVALADSQRLASHVQGAVDRPGSQERVGHFLLLAEDADAPAGFQPRTCAIELTQQGPAHVDAGPAHIFGHAAGGSERDPVTWADRQVRVVEHPALTADAGSGEGASRGEVGEDRVVAAA